MLEIQEIHRKNYYKFYDDYNEEEIELFPGIIMHEAVVFKHRDTGQEILAVHGHQGDIMNDKLWRLI